MLTLRSSTLPLSPSCTLPPTPTAQMNPGDGAFYGPKIDITVYDALRRKFQCATVQLDFQMPIRFGLEYVKEDGTYDRPVIVHRCAAGWAPGPAAGGEEAWEGGGEGVGQRMGKRRGGGGAALRSLAPGRARLRL